MAFFHCFLGVQSASKVGATSYETPCILKFLTVSKRESGNEQTVDSVNTRTRICLLHRGSELEPSLLPYSVFLLAQFNGARTTVSRVSHTFAWRNNAAVTSNLTCHRSLRAKCIQQFTCLQTYVTRSGARSRRTRSG